MKKIVFITAFLVLLASCQHKPDFDRDFHITLDGDNTYVAGEPVKFNINGSIGNILFYSGEPGAEYEHRDRFYLSEDDIESATLILEIQPRYKGDVYPGGLDIYVTDRFEGLLWNDGDQDRQTVEAMSDGMQSWKKLEYTVASSAEWIGHQYDVTEYVDNFALAMHWHPQIGEWGKYMVNGDILVRPKGGLPDMTYDIKEIGLSVLNIPASYEPYKTGSEVGMVNFNSSDGEVAFMGSTGIDYQVDSWLFSTPAPVCRMEGDAGLVIKNLRNDIDSFEYSWETPGLYKVVFVSVDYAAGVDRRIISEFNINIVASIK